MAAGGDRRAERARRDAEQASAAICADTQPYLEPGEAARFALFLDLPGRHAGVGGVTDWIGDRSAMATGAAAAHSAGFPAAKSMAVVLTDRRLAFFRQKQSLLRAKAGDHLGDVRLDDLTEVYAEDGRQTGTAITGQTTRFGLVAFRVRSGHQVVLQALHLAAPGLFLASFGAGSAPDRAG